MNLEGAIGKVMCLGIAISFGVLLNSCERQKETVDTKLVTSRKIAIQFYGTSSDSAKLVVHYLVTDKYDDEVSNFCFGCDGVGSRYGYYIKTQCVIDSLIVGPGDYIFPFDISHPCIDPENDSSRRFQIEKYDLTQFKYRVAEDSYQWGSPASETDFGMSLIGFDSLGMKADF